MATHPIRIRISGTAKMCMYVPYKVSSVTYLLYHAHKECSRFIHTTARGHIVPGGGVHIVHYIPSRCGITNL